MVYQSTASVFYGRSPNRVERLLFDIIEGREKIADVQKAAVPGINEELVKVATEFIAQMNADSTASHQPSGSDTARAYSLMISRALEIVSKFGRDSDASRELLAAASMAIPGLRPHPRGGVPIPVDTEALGWKTTKVRG